MKTNLLDPILRLPAEDLADTGADPCTPLYPWYEPVRQFLDYCAAALLLAAFAPVIGLAVVLVKLTSRGPAFYLQTRLGRYGKLFTIYKLRTMVHNCERLSGPCWAKNNDPRVTPIGNWLRKLHIDELPQLWNVLCGDMSLVGPRPERPEFLHDLEKAVPGYRNRLLARPGITGLAQVQLPPDIDIDCVREKLPYDLYYVRQASPWLDLQIYLATAMHLFSAPVPLRRSLLMLPFGDQLLSAAEAGSEDEAFGLFGKWKPQMKLIAQFILVSCLCNL
jgi:lipopolysaccharide/colanic/teichoic acid biosynthesis glycosyltransferase